MISFFPKSKTATYFSMRNLSVQADNLFEGGCSWSNTKPCSNSLVSLFHRVIISDRLGHFGFSASLVPLRWKDRYGWTTRLDFLSISEGYFIDLTVQRLFTIHDWFFNMILSGINSWLGLKQSFIDTPTSIQRKFGSVNSWTHPHTTIMNMMSSCIEDQN